MNRIEQIRKNINNGMYDSDEVVDATVENLHANILAGGQGRDRQDVEDDGMSLAAVVVFGVPLIAAAILIAL